MLQAVSRLFFRRKVTKEEGRWMTVLSNVVKHVIATSGRAICVENQLKTQK